MSNLDAKSYWFFWAYLYEGRIYNDGPRYMTQPDAAIHQWRISHYNPRATIYRYLWLPRNFVSGSVARWILDTRHIQKLTGALAFHYPGPSPSAVLAGDQAFDLEPGAWGQEVGRGGGGRGGGGRGGGRGGPRGRPRGRPHRHHHGRGRVWGPGWSDRPWWGCPPWDPDCEEEAPILDARRIAGADPAIIGMDVNSDGSIGAEKLEPALRGKWPTVDYPKTVKLAGRVFVRAEWYWPYPNVRAQYREDAAQKSMHLFVLADGTWIVPHIDAENPDKGDPVRHMVEDVIRHPVYPPV